MRRHFMLLLLLPALCQGQGVRLKVAGEWEEIEAERTQSELRPGWRIAGFRTRDRLTRYLDGARSGHLAGDSRPSLAVDPGEGETLADYALIRLRERRGYRRLPQADPRKCGYTRLEPADFEMAPGPGESFECRPRRPLPGGEYIVLCLRQSPRGEPGDYLVHAFGVP